VRTLFELAVGFVLGALLVLSARRALRLEALAEAPGTFGSTYRGELVIAGNHEARGGELR
jgi:hypothetical protein